MDATKVVKLKEPIHFGQELIESLVLRKPIAKDLRSFPLEPKMGDIFDLVAKLAGRESAVIDRLSVEDLMEVSAIVGGFIPGGLATGSKP